MIVEVEHYLGDTLLSGKVRSVGQLKYRVRSVLRDTHPDDFVRIFCARYGFEILPELPEMQVDYCIDLDTKVPLIQEIKL